MVEIRLQKELTGSTGAMPLDVNINIEKGSLVTLYGNSGSGKTSILRMVSGLLVADQGHIKVNQKTWLDTNNGVRLKPQDRKIGFVFQDYALFPNMTVRENLLYALEKGEDDQVVKDLIKTIELENLQDRKPKFLSGGQKQRVALARALVRKPDLLLLDEPLAALDRNMRTKLQEYILKVHRQYNLTTILVSHDVGEVVKMSEYIYVLENGKITNHGNPLEVFTQKQISGKFQFPGEVLKIDKEDVIYIVTVLVGSNIVKVVAEESEVKVLAVGDNVIIASKAFNPIIKKLN